LVLFGFVPGKEIYGNRTTIDECEKIMFGVDLTKDKTHSSTGEPIGKFNQ
jgi:hypothetical protein